jgi:hypothetical protein
MSKAMINQFLISLALALIGYGANAQSGHVIYKADQYTVYRDSIVQQNKYTAKVISSKEITSNYQSPANLFKSPQLTFKFSINGKDNEMLSGVDHQFACVAKDGYCETPLITFGKQLKDNAEVPAGTYLAPNTRLKIRLDMRHVVNAFNTEGYYTTFKGEKIYKEDFKGVFVAGGTEPMTWDFDNLVHHPKLQLKDDDTDGIYEAELVLNAFEDKKQIASEWKQTKDLSPCPQYTSSYPVSNALYQMALEEMVGAIEPDSTFRTGKEWAGVWTRDISYSIILSMAYLQPQVSRYSLLRKVNAKKRIIQDTGTGGAWPASTDRIVWAIAAWELYKATGDRDWLQEAYTIIRNSVEDDLHTAYDPRTGLVKGESSFLDWREQTYPKWMQPADIFESLNLGTNAVHYQANVILGQMAEALNDKAAAAKYRGVAARIKSGINNYLWQPSKGYYAQYLYGRNYKMLSPRAEALGEALCILFGIAEGERVKQVVSSTPVTGYGITCIYPQIPNIPPYHNNGVWPFVQSFWMWAGARAGNEKSVLESISAIYRPAALFATNKENFVAQNGDYSGTQINSSNMLWSLAGNISIVHKILFGIHFNENDLSFQPFVPRALMDKRTLTNFKYRDAILNIEMEGYGNKIKSFLLDGRVVPAARIPSSLNGVHSVKIVLASQPITSQTIKKVANHFTLAEPKVSYTNGRLSWNSQAGSKIFKVLKNGTLLTTVSATTHTIRESGYGEYQVIAVDDKGFESFASEPIVIAPRQLVKTYEVEDYNDKADYSYKGYSGSGFTEISTIKSQKLSIPITVEESGIYAIDFKYANGNGPTNTENKCAIRTLYIDGKEAGVLAFPQRGKEEWSNWGYSNSVQFALEKGTHAISLIYKDWNENMNGAINQAMIDQLRVVRTEGKTTALASGF